MIRARNAAGTTIGSSGNNVIIDMSSINRGWNLGYPISNLTNKGNIPKWITVRQRFWKNEAFYNPEKYNTSNLSRMQKGLAPQRVNPLTGTLESMELHHTPPMREGGLFEFQQVWPEEHALIDSYRHAGY